ncbi:MAG: hypothetical protein JXR59_11695 [Desulfuromonadaceae bacterium]|nr:hypothetical protein [Desulfuromonadaceae bacterium]
MKGETLVSAITAQRQPEHAFICWQQDAGPKQYELLDYFINRRAQQEEVTSFELLDMEQMWQALLALGEPGFSRAVRKDVEVIDWQVAHQQGRVRSCCFRAEGLMAVYDEVAALKAQAKKD